MDEKLANLIKEKTIKVNLMHNISFMQSHASHNIHTLHQIYVLLSETGMQDKKKRGLALDKSFRKTFEEK